MHLEFHLPEIAPASVAALFPSLSIVDWAQPVALAVSGGGDSMALLLAVVLYRRQKSIDAPLHVLTVDHGLRSDAALEAAAVHEWCGKAGIAHETLTWKGASPTTALAENARYMRRDLLLAACRKRGCRQLLLAHTMDDVAETLLMRVRRGGLRGHASIPVQTGIGQTLLIRPFIKSRRGELRAALDATGINWFEDPTNNNYVYERPRVRYALRALETSKYNTKAIASYADIMGRWRQVLAREIAHILNADCHLTGCDVVLQDEVLKAYPKTVGLEALRELIRFVGGDAHMINRDQATIVLQKTLETGVDRKRFSAGRCVMSPRKQGGWILSRALRGLPTDKISAGESQRWDGRFVLHCFGGAGTSATVLPHNNLPKVVSVEAECQISFRPQVMDGPISCLDEPIFQAFSSLLARSVD